MLKGTTQHLLSLIHYALQCPSAAQTEMVTAQAYVTTSNNRPTGAIDVKPRDSWPTEAYVALEEEKEVHLMCVTTESHLVF